jgi:hypothetical protein
VFESVSVFYYSGESFSYYPYLKPYCGYKLKNITLPDNNDYSYDPDASINTRKVSVSNFKNSDKILAKTEEGFVLEYIEVPRPRYEGDEDVPGCTPVSQHMWQRYVVDDAHHTDYGYPMWNSLLLSDYDNGLYLCEPSVGNNTLHTYTTKIQFKFNKQYSDESVMENILVYDAIDDNMVYTELRPDSNELADYPIIFDGPGFWEQYGNSDYGASTGELNMELKNMNKVPNKNHAIHLMCNLQRFNIDIINTVAHPIVTTDMISDVPIDTLCNIPMNKPYTRFSASTIPPKLSRQTKYFVNASWLDDGLMYDEQPEVIIGNVTADAMNNAPRPNTIIDTMYQLDSLGRVIYKPTVDRFPNTGCYDHLDVGYNNKWVNTNGIYGNSSLSVKQNIVDIYHWMDQDGANCPDVIDAIANVIKIGVSIYSTFTSGDSSNIVITTKKDTIKISTSEVNTIIDEVADVAKGFCIADDEMGSTNFWLAKDGSSLNFNSQYRYEEMFGATSAAAAELIWNTKYYQDWNLWGVGTYGLYKSTDREAYNIKLDANGIEPCVCGLPMIINGITYFSFRPILVAKPSFYTRIELWTSN